MVLGSLGWNHQVYPGPLVLENKFLNLCAHFLAPSSYFQDVSFESCLRIPVPRGSSIYPPHFPYPEELSRTMRHKHEDSKSKAWECVERDHALTWRVNSWEKLILGT